MENNIILVKDLSDSLAQAIVIDKAMRHLLTQYDKKELEIVDYEHGYGNIKVQTMHSNGMFVNESKTVMVGVRIKDITTGDYEVMLREKDYRSAVVSDWYVAHKDVMEQAPAWLAGWKQADENEKRPCADWKVGDYIVGTNDASKLSDVDDYLHDFIEYSEPRGVKRNTPVLLYIERIKELTDEELMQKNLFFDRNPELLEGFKGGSFVDDKDVPEDFDFNKFGSYPVHVQRCSVQHVMLLRTPTKWVAVDPQGYDYCRYVHFPIEYKELFAEEYEAAKEHIDQRKRKEAERKQRKEDELREKYRQRAFNALFMVDTDKMKLPKDRHDKRTRSANMKRILSTRFPQVKFNVSFTYRHDCHHISIEVDGPIDRDELNEFCQVFYGDAYDRGETNDYGYPCKTMCHNEVTKYTGIFNYIGYDGSFV